MYLGNFHADHNRGGCITMSTIFIIDLNNICADWFFIDFYGFLFMAML